MWQVKDITLQLVENTPGKDTDIILGGGLASFLPYYGVYNKSDTLRDYPKILHFLPRSFRFGGRYGQNVVYFHRNE
jgi:hypothetical protein